MPVVEAFYLKAKFYLLLRKHSHYELSVTRNSTGNTITHIYPTITIVVLIRITQYLKLFYSRRIKFNFKNRIRSLCKKVSLILSIALFVIESNSCFLISGLYLFYIPYLTLNLSVNCSISDIATFTPFRAYLPAVVGIIIKLRVNIDADKIVFRLGGKSIKIKS